MNGCEYSTQLSETMTKSSIELIFVCTINKVAVLNKFIKIQSSYKKQLFKSQPMSITLRVNDNYYL